MLNQGVSGVRQDWTKVLMLGDSLMATGAAYATPLTYMVQIPGYCVDAAGGRTLSYFATNIATVLAANPTCDGVFTNCGANDIVLSGRTPAQMITDLTTIRDAVIADGKEFCVAQMTPFKDGIYSNWTSALQTKWDEYNDALPDWCVTRGHHCCLAYDIMEDKDNPDYMQPEYAYENPGNDHLHYGIDGAKRLARVWDGAIMASRRRIRKAA